MGRAMNEYTSFAKVYDRFMDNVPYEEWADRTDGLIRKYLGNAEGNAERLHVVDAGCGTGVFSELLSARGYRVTGADISEDMLAEAERRRQETGSDILYICQDMRELDPGEQADAVVSVCDCVNYLLSAGDVTRFFAAVKRALKPGGVLVFDYTTPHRYRDEIGDATIAESRDDCAFIWENCYHEEEHINEYELTLFAAAPGSDPAADGAPFLRSVEVHFQRGYTPEEIRECAADAGLEVLFEEDGEEGGAVSGDSGRVRAVLG